MFVVEEKILKSVYFHKLLVLINELLLTLFPVTIIFIEISIFEICFEQSSEVMKLWG